MTTRELTIAALTAIAVAGGAYVLDDKGALEQVQLTAEPVAVTLGLSAEEKTALIEAATKAGVKDGDTVTCAAGLWLDGVWRSDLESCTNGKGAAWQRTTIDGAAAEASVEVEP